LVGLWLSIAIDNVAKTNMLAAISACSLFWYRPNACVSFQSFIIWIRQGYAQSIHRLMSLSSARSLLSNRPISWRYLGAEVFPQ